MFLTIRNEINKHLRYRAVARVQFYCLKKSTFPRVILAYD